MRKIGIIKWYGGKNYKTGKQNDFGFISMDNGDDLRFKKMDILTSENNLREGSIVTFDLDINPRNRKTIAKRVLLLSEETDNQLLNFCWNSNNKRFWKAVLNSYLKRKPPEESSALLTQKLKTLPSMIEKRLFIRDVPKHFFFYSVELRKLLPIDEHLALCLHFLNEREYDNSILRVFKEELLLIINNYSIGMRYKILPIKLLFIDRDLRETLEPRHHLDVLLKMFDQSQIEESNMDNLFEELLSLLNKVPQDSKDTILSRIPPETFKRNKKFRSMLPYLSQVKIILELLSIETRASLINELRVCLEKQNNEEIWELIPPNIIKEPDIACLAPDHIIAGVLVEEWMNSKEANTISQLSSLISKSSKADQQRVMHMLPIELKLHPSFFIYLPSNDQVKYTWNEIEEAKWFSLSTKAKLLAIYRAAKYDEKIAIINHINKEKEPVIKYGLLLLSIKIQPQKKQQIFDEAHYLLESYVSDMVWSSIEPIDLDLLLPHCSYGHVTYCEGKVWRENQEPLNDPPQRAFCPRTNGACSAGLASARLTADCTQEWHKWSLLELMKSLDVNTYLPRYKMQRNDVYPLKISGWINRLNEIRARLKCTYCGETLKPNMKYSKSFARYNNTIFFCPQSKDNNHDHNIYLNHCWACRKIIDSRENKIQYENYYLCLDCGSGPRESKEYKQGDICPKCDLPRMKQLTERAFKCTSYTCGHKINVPPDFKQTGRRMFNY
ncbi:hypothetical protein [Mesobacillus jeotgali]|uniref:hypothetical protein n=1 Tax=Mesobacillus jeotgali TaxID=129985 RepID=UPI0009A812C1|nr:hypothetical protein [Mesobacillus jeotgali]